MNEYPAWVFVSHASADLENVRKVRNFLEENGASPILFYLRSLTEPEKFWPLIEQEIAARNFFLFCDSDAARSSHWVQRERDAVREISNKRPIRIGRVSVQNEVDFAIVRRFLKNMFVYVSGPDTNEMVRHTFIEFGFKIVGSVGWTSTSLTRLGDGSQMSDDMISHLEYGARNGWFVAVVNADLAASDNLYDNIPTYIDDGNTVVIATEPNIDVERYKRLPRTVVVQREAREDFEETVRRAARMMLVSD